MQRAVGKVLPHNRGTRHCAACGTVQHAAGKVLPHNRGTWHCAACSTVQQARSSHALNAEADR